jgi:hypothetical protein
MRQLYLLRRDGMVPSCPDAKKRSRRNRGSFETNDGSDGLCRCSTKENIEMSQNNQNQNPGQQSQNPNQKPGQQQGGGQKPGQQSQNPGQQNPNR